MRRIRVLLATGLTALLGVVAACDSFAEGDPSTEDGGSPSDGAAGSDGTSTGDAADGAGLPKTTCAGMCPTSLVATSQNEIPWLALDTSRVIWMRGLVEGGGNGDLFACPKAACPSTGPTPLATSVAGGSLASDGVDAFLGGSSQSLGVRRLVGDVLQTVVPSENAIYSMVVRDRQVYFASWVGSEAAYSRTISVHDIAQGMTKYVGTYVPADDNNTAPMAVAKSRIFFGSHNKARLVGCALPACTTFVELAASAAHSLATDDVRIFWTDGVTLLSCGVDEAPCLPRPELPLAAGVPVAVIHHRGELFIETGGGDMLVCDATSCATTWRVIAHETAFDSASSEAATNLAADDTSLFYVAHDGVDYQVKRLTRNAP